MRHVTRMTIDDADHYTPQQRADIIATYPAHEQEARVRGEPTLGSGRVYPITEEAITCDPFEIPRHYARIGGLDFGWDHPTAAAKLAHDRDTDCVYLCAAYRVKEQTPLIHAAALKPWGEKMPWAWPQDAYQRDKRAGGTLRDDYIKHGLNMLPEHATFDSDDARSNSVEAGIMVMLERMMTGRFKVFRTLGDWLSEFRRYHRKDGLIVKEFDDLLDATRYAIMMLRFAEPDTARAIKRPTNNWVV